MERTKPNIQASVGYDRAAWNFSDDKTRYLDSRRSCTAIPRAMLFQSSTLEKGVIFLWNKPLQRVSSQGLFH